MNQFSRTELLIGKDGVEKLHNAKVAVFGVGGVGSFVVEGLVRAGVGNFILVDDDEVCLTNLNRQIHATRKTIGKYKADLMEDRILEINPDAKVEVFKEFFMPDSEVKILDESVDYIVDAIDTVTGKIELVMQADKLNIPIMSAMGTGNKLDPTRFEVTDIYKTSVCPLAKEEPIKPYESAENSCKNHCVCPPGAKRTCAVKNQVPGSISFVPSVAGMIIAGEVIKDLIKK